MTPAPPSPRRGAAGRAGPGPAAAHPAPALCGWVAPPPPRPAPPPRLVSPAGGDLPGCRPPGAAGLCAGLPRESGAAVPTPAPRSRCRRRSPALPGSCRGGRTSRSGEAAVRGHRRDWSGTCEVGPVSRQAPRRAGGSGAALQRGALSAGHMLPPETPQCHSPLLRCLFAVWPCAHSRPTSQTCL